MAPTALHAALLPIDVSGREFTWKARRELDACVAGIGAYKTAHRLSFTLGEPEPSALNPHSVSFRAVAILIEASQGCDPRRRGLRVLSARPHAQGVRRTVGARASYSV